MRVDVHQHIWTQPLLEALAARDCVGISLPAGALSAVDAPLAIDSVLERLVGSGQLVYGSDRPVVEQTPGAGDGELLAKGTQLARPMAAAA